MRALRLLAVAAALLLAAGELARRGTAIVPLGLDDLAVAALLLWAAWASGRRGAAPLLLAWGVFCGFVLVLLALNSAPLFDGTPKPGAWRYTAILGVMLLLGGWACRRAMLLLPGGAERAGARGPGGGRRARSFGRYSTFCQNSA
ncbi:hypothetical protein LPC08_17695 [Roseomonas sp. OT10]|uniref:hypothetical protein n=1 Tax=Roseomonas cutis TaxID=2897332 RepID=UPI001E283854|nr:hypothetical protein [Roseomonas sp. OT10]UFN47832.1 hypothetical protein LPC08_17695 [Roseomonas sp. OT10]